MKTKFDFEIFKKLNVAVHCKTKEEAEDFCKKMHEHGMKWNGSGDSFLEITRYHVFQKETCYSGTGCYCPYDYYKENEYTILEWSDYMQKEFTKADLKDGMIVEYRDGTRRIVIGNAFIGKDGFNYIDNYKCSLESYRNKVYDICKVYSFLLPYGFNSLFKDNNLKLIWERTEVKNMTTEEMRKKLEELTGEKIEIESNRRVGQWFLLDECSNSGVYCSICGKKVYKEDYANQKIKSKFCPNCGAIMEC